MTFLPGLALAQRFHAEAVRPVLREHCGDPVHAAALLGPGSEVLGFDTARSTDHDWGPRLLVFLDHPDGVAATLDRHLPATFAGVPVRFPVRDSPPRHGVLVCRQADWFTGQLGFDPTAPIGTADWLATSTQSLAEVVGGAVFHDGAGTLEPARAALRWYPEDVWRYLLACQWTRIEQEEAFAGRAAEVGDELGSMIVTARLVRDLVRLVLLQHKVYPPYSKWLGSAFGRLPVAARLTPALTGALTAAQWPQRERHLCAAYRVAAQQHNALALTAPLDPEPRAFHDRPFQVIGGGRFADALCATITDLQLRALPRTGALDQFADSTDLTGDRDLSRAVTAGLLHRACTGV